MDYRVLGPLEVADGERAVALSTSKERKLLAILLINANHVVSADRLLDEIWGADQPASGLKALRYHVSKLRDVLYPDRSDLTDVTLRTQSPGYVLDVDPDALDASRFARLVEEARTSMADDAGRAEELLRQALALWRGPAWADFRFDEFAQPAIQGLEEARLEAVELLMQAGLDLGRHHELLSELTTLVAEHPLREGLRSRLMIALYRAGRQAEALQTYRLLRDQLGEDLGLEPSTEIQELEERILLQDPALRGASTLVVDDADGPGTGLPRPLTSFVGRVGETAEVAAMLGANRLVTITGTGGAGKTRLAVEIANRCREQFRDGVWFVDLSAVDDPDMVDQAIFDAVGATEIDAASVRESVIGRLADAEALIVLDNCEHVVDAAAGWARRLIDDTDRVSILTTSQQALGVEAEAVFTTPPMQHGDTTSEAVLRSDAGLLFMDRARSSRPGFTPTAADAAAIAHIVTSLDGIPLAIELAAARTRMMSTADIAHNLVHRFRLLTDGSPDVERQQTLQAAVQWSYDLMEEHEQHFFDGLSCFAGSFSLDAAAYVGAESDQLEVFDLLGGLVDKSLVVVVEQSEGEVRHRLPQSMRLFGAARLASRQRTDEVDERHASYHLGFVRDGDTLLQGPDQAVWQLRFRVAAPDIRLTLRHLVETRADDALVAVNGLARYWYREGTNREGIAWLQQALEATPPEPTRDRANALRWLAGLQHVSGQSESARVTGRNAAAMAEQVGDWTALAASLNLLGSDHLYRGELPDAITCFEQAIHAEIRGGLPRAMPLMWNLGVANLHLADIDGVAGAARRLRSLDESERDFAASAVAADLLDCDAAIVRGELAEARRLAGRAHLAYMRADHPADVAEVHDRLAEICMVEADFAGAMEHVEVAAELRQETSSERQWRAALVVGRVALAAGDSATCAVELSGVLAMAIQRREPLLLSWAFHIASQLAMATDQIGAARRLNAAVVELAAGEHVTVQASIVAEVEAMRLALGSPPEVGPLDASPDAALETATAVIQRAHQEVASRDQGR